MLTLPAVGRREVRAACNPSRPLIPEEQVLLHEDLSIVQGGDRIAQVESRIRDSWGDLYVRELVTGHAGCGKSTELLRLATELRKPKEGRAYHVVYVDAYEYLNPFEVRLPQLLVSLMAALSEEPRVDLQRTRSGPRLWGQIRTILEAAGREIGKDLATELPVLKSLMRVDLHLVRNFRRQSDDHIQQVLSLFRDLVVEVRTQLPADQSEIVFVIDNLEKIPDGETETKVSLHETLFLRELPLLDVPAHLILTYPISLNYSSVALRQVFHEAQQTTIPMVGIRQKAGTVARGDDADGIAALRRLVARRVRLDKVFAGEDAITAVIRESGGCVRDLLRLVAGMPTVGSIPFSITTVDAVIADYVNEYERILQGKAYLPLLHIIERTGAFPIDTDGQWKQQLLLGLVVLEYDTGTWYDVHPLAKRTSAFRAAASAS
jgi:AAA ATPase domain